MRLNKKDRKLLYILGNYFTETSLNLLVFFKDISKKKNQGKTLSDLMLNYENIYLQEHYNYLEEEASIILIEQIRLELITLNKLLKDLHLCTN